MDAPLTRFFVACLERQVAEIDAAALTNGIGMNLYAWASADAGIKLNLPETDQSPRSADERKCRAKGGITFMSRLYAHKNKTTDKYPLDIDFDYTGEMELGVNCSIGFDLEKLFGSNADHGRGPSISGAGINTGFGHGSGRNKVRTSFRHHPVCTRSLLQARVHVWL
jgi:hypothetical protein